MGDYPELSNVGGSINILQKDVIEGAVTPPDISEYLRKLEDAIAMSYGYLWHVKTGSYKEAYEARKVLRDIMTHDQRGEAIKRVRELMGHNAVLSGVALAKSD